MQNVIVLGGSYGGVRAAHLLANGLGSGYRVIMIDRNSHANHLYTMPRFAVVPGHEHKTFIPYTNIFGNASSSSKVPADSSHLVLHAKIIALNSDFVTLDRSFPEYGLDSPAVPYRYAVYALGSVLPKPIDLWSPIEETLGEQGEKKDAGAEETAKESKEYDGMKQDGMSWLQKCQDRVRKAQSVLCVGGGALGIQFATDIKTLYPQKQVTLLHSRHRLLPRFDYDLHSEVKKSMEEMQIDMILGERLDLASTAPDAVKYNEQGQRVVKTVTGREVAADLLLLCTGQTPNTELLREMAPECVDPQSKLAYVLPTMQLGVIPTEPPAEPPTEPVPSLAKLTLEDQSTDSVLLAPISSPSLSSSPSSPTSRSESTLDSESEAETEGEEEPEFETLPETPYGHIFAVGDAADAFGAIKAGHTAYWQAEVAARNIIRLARRSSSLSCPLSASSPSISSSSSSAVETGAEESADEGPVELESYVPGPPAIKVSLGLGHRGAYQIDGNVGLKDVEEPEDLDVEGAWIFYGMKITKPEDLYL